MNSNQNGETVEDTPQYRSVMMQPLAAPSLPRSFANYRPTSKVQPRTQIKEPTISPSVWKVAELPALPAEYILGRTNVYVESTSQEVASRICDCLRLESTAATFDEDDKNLLLAETKDCLKFAVRLFADKGMVVVEVQRQSGCSFQFREASRTVLKSAKGMRSMAPKRKFTMPSCIPKESMEQKQKRMEDGLQIAFNMLRTDRADSQMLAMESLEQLTRSSESRGTAAKAVLGGDFLRKIVSLEEAGVSDLLSDMEERRVSIMKRLALAVLANALCALSESGELNSLLCSTAQLKSRSLVCALVSDLRDSSSSPHEATQAARCMQYLMNAHEVEGLLVEMSAMSAVTAACTVGACCNATLERESKKLKLGFTSV